MKNLTLVLFFVLATMASARTNGDPADLISGAAMGAVGVASPVYGVTVHTEATQWGRLACAGVVSAIVKQAGFGVGIHFTTTALRDALLARGWKRVPKSELSAGDVVFWGADQTSRPGHVGVIVASTIITLTVDNNSLIRRVGLHPLARPIITEFPVAQYGLRHPKSSAWAN